MVSQILATVACKRQAGTSSKIAGYIRLHTWPGLVDSVSQQRRLRGNSEFGRDVPAECAASCTWLYMTRTPDCGPACGMQGRRSPNQVLEPRYTQIALQSERIALRCLSMRQRGLSGCFFTVNLAVTRFPIFLSRESKDVTTRQLARASHKIPKIPKIPFIPIGGVAWCGQ